jgi:hypothetical protein
VLGPAGLVEVPTAAALRLGAPDRVARLLGPVGETARAALREAVAPFLHAPLPAPAALPEPVLHRPGPPVSLWRRPVAAPSGALPLAPVHVTIGGLRVALTRAADADGRLVDLGLSVAREGAAQRGLLEGLAASTSLGLAQGVPLSHFVACFAHARIGPPGGRVEGDPDIQHAVSVVDWAFRRLAIDHLGRRDLADPEPQPDTPAPALLPLDLPRHGPPPGLTRAELPATAAPRRRGAARLAG